MIIKIRIKFVVTHVSFCLSAGLIVCDDVTTKNGFFLVGDGDGWSYIFSWNVWIFHLFYITFAYKEDKKMDTTTVRKPASFRLNAELFEMLKRYKHEKGNLRIWKLCFAIFANMDKCLTRIVRTFCWASARIAWNVMWKTTSYLFGWTKTKALLNC